MSEQPNPIHHDENEPFIPPQYMLYVALIGLIIAGITAFTQPEFTVIGWGGLGIALLGGIAWVLMSPQEARSFIMGRSFRIGGMTLLISAIFLFALIALYAFVKDQNWRVDLTQRDSFSLTEAARDEIRKLGADPTRPLVKITAFYGVSQAGRRDRDTLLFDDYVESSNGKITYDFIDPDRNPIAVQEFGNPRPGQLVVAKVAEDGSLDLENKEFVTTVTQEALTNAVLQVSAQGDFRAYFLTVDQGLQLEDNSEGGLSALQDNLDRLKWTVKQLTLFELTSPESEDRLDSPADGVVLVIPGGETALPDDQLKLITDYLDQGGSLVLLPSVDVNDTLATADNLSNYLYEKFGLRFNRDFVIDPSASAGSPLTPLATEFDASSFITSIFGQGSLMLFDVAHSIDINPTAPLGVTVTQLAKSTAQSYSKTGLTSVTAEDLRRADTDATGPFVLAASAENAVTGARVVLFSSQFVPTNRYETLSAVGVQNLNAVFRSLAWATGFDSFVTEIPQVGFEFRPQDTPVFAQDSELRTINLVTVVLLPFGILLLGFFVWWNTRTRDSAR